MSLCFFFTWLVLSERWPLSLYYSAQVDKKVGETKNSYVQLLVLLLWLVQSPVLLLWDWRGAKWGLVLGSSHNNTKWYLIPWKNHPQNLIILFTSNSKKEEAFFQKLCCFMTWLFVGYGKEHIIGKRVHKSAICDTKRDPKGWVYNATISQRRRGVKFTFKIHTESKWRSSTCVFTTAIPRVLFSDPKI